MELFFLFFKACICNVNGTVANEGCNQNWGECRCKPYVIGAKCDHCRPNYYGLDDSYYGCKYCDCSPEGSIKQQCHNITGQCQCRPHMKGRKCDEIETGYYCPALDYLTYEAEHAVKFNSEANIVEETNLFSYSDKYGHIGPGRRVHVKENGEFTMDIDHIDISGSFEILLRYQANDDWSVRMQIRVKNDYLSGGKCDKYFYESTFTIQNGKRSHLTTETFCFDNRQRYEVVLKFTQGWNYSPNGKKTLLIDSVGFKD